MAIYTRYIRVAEIAQRMRAYVDLRRITPQNHNLLTSRRVPDVSRLGCNASSEWIKRENATDWQTRHHTSYSCRRATIKSLRRAV